MSYAWGETANEPPGPTAWFEPATPVEQAPVFEMFTATPVEAAERPEQTIRRLAEVANRAQSEANGMRQAIERFLDAPDSCASAYETALAGLRRVVGRAE